MSSPSQNSPIEARAARRLGTVIAGKYTLERVLGAGGMATVFLGVHRNGHRVAIKMLHPELSIDPSLAERFVREGYVANAIGHPGTVKVLDDDRAEDGAPFLVMELLEGETLAAAAARHGGTMPAEELLPIAHALCEVLSAAHARGVVHRDIKPENLFLTDEGKLKVLDFGIARVRDGSGTDATQTGRTLGTPAFMPPEQALARTDEIDARTDVWAVGATMFALLSGAHVHEAKTGPEVLVATATRPARSLRDALPEAPAMIVEVVDRALRFARDDRWPSADALRDALEVSYTEAFGAPLPRMYPSPSGGPRAASGPISGGLPRASTTDRSGAKAAIAAAIGKVNAGSSPGPNPASKPAPSPALSSAPTIAAGPVTGAATQVSGAPPPRPARLGLWAALFLAGGLLLSLGVQRLRAPAPPAGPPSASAAAPPPACASSRACREKLGKPAICRADRTGCAPLEAEGCRILAEPGDVENEATIWLGAMFPMTGIAGREYGVASVNAVDLGRHDFRELSNGLPPARPGGPSRPLAVVACDDAESPERAAAHLIDGLGVPAVIGFSRSKEVLDLAASHFNPKGVLALASNTAPMLRDIPHLPGGPRLVWRTTTSSSMEVPAVTALIGEVIEPRIRASLGPAGATERLRVAMARIDNTSGTGYADGLISRLRFNGKSVAENGPSFQVFLMRDVDDAAMKAEVTRLSEEIAAFRPHLVLVAVDEHAIVADIERRWPAGEKRPFYLLGAGLSDPPVLKLVEEHPEVRKRLLGLNTSSSRASVAKFVSRYNERYSPKVTPADATDAPYDAFYLLAYAIASVGDAPITGAALGRAMGRMVPPGPLVEVGPGGIHSALSALAAGKNIDVDGTTTTLDFDLETGDATADFSVFCLGGGEKGAPLEVMEAGMTFTARTGKLEGAIRCP